MTLADSTVLVTIGVLCVHGLPVLLNFPAPHLKSYSRETIVAEKFEAMVKFGMFNSRMKDFFDIWTLSQKFSFECVVLSRAIKTTFETRGTQVPADWEPLSKIDCYRIGQKRF